LCAKLRPPACLLPIVSSTVVALRRDDGLDGVQDVVLVDVPQRVRQPRERFLIAVRATHAAADDQIVSLPAGPSAQEVDSIIAETCDYALLTSLI